MKKLSKYIITIVIGILIAFLVAYSKDIFNQEAKKDIFHILSDSFFVPGVAISGIGLLMFVSNEGAFDGLAFAMMSFFKLFSIKNEKKFKTYNDYKEQKREKKNPVAFILISGLFLIGVSIIMLILYYNC